MSEESQHVRFICVCDCESCHTHVCHTHVCIMLRTRVNTFVEYMRDSSKDIYDSSIESYMSFDDIHYICIYIYIYIYMCIRDSSKESIHILTQYMY